MKRMLGLILAIAGAVVVAMSAYSALVTQHKVFGYDYALVGAAGLAAVTAGIIAFQK
jgi:hypothetical protein